VHVEHDIAASDEFSIDVDLRDGGPGTMKIRIMKVRKSA
jgi:hypothetical protein